MTSDSSEQELGLASIAQAAERIDELLQAILRLSGLDLTYTITPATASGVTAVEWRGHDVPMLVARHGELLLALEHLAAKALRLEPEQHDLIYFEAGGFKASRERKLRVAAASAVEAVRRTGKPHAFQPMSSHERRLLHLALTPSGLRTASEGEGPLRHLVLHPLAIGKPRLNA